MNTQANTGGILALSGGVGGAKLALGLARSLPPESLTVVCNTGDDFDHLGLRICPDLDTVMYTLAGLNNQQQGWGLEGESWQVMERLKQLGGEAWFNLGDKDIATHLMRTSLLGQGLSLTAVTQRLCDAMGVSQRILPMSDDRVATQVTTADDTLNFQHYFVREQCRPAVRGFEFHGIADARPNPEFLALLTDPMLEAVILCPSNPFVSIDPILNLPGVRDALRQCPAPVIAVSPIVGGQAIKGPTAKMMVELGISCTAVSIAEYYSDFLDGFVLDAVDGDHLSEVKKFIPDVVVTNTVMTTLEDRILLAAICLDLGRQAKNK